MLKKAICSALVLLALGVAAYFFIAATVLTWIL